MKIRKVTAIEEGYLGTVDHLEKQADGKGNGSVKRNDHVIPHTNI